MKDALGGLLGLAALSMTVPAVGQADAQPDSGMSFDSAVAFSGDTETSAEPTPESSDTADTGAAVAPLETVSVSDETAPAPIEEPTRSAGPSRLIDEVVVTAQKREENLQDVPISVAAFSGEELEARGISDPMALATITPGLTYNNLVGYSLIYIRGVGSDAFEPTADQSVATYLDGVYLPFAHGLAQEFVKLERIEVLKGPQGTLFGRNATGGAINIVTRQPGDHFELDVDGTLGSFDNREAKAFVSIPFSDGLRASVSGLYKKTDSYYDLASDSAVTSLDPDKSRGLDVRLQWAPLEQISVMGSALFTRSEGPGSIINTVENPKPLGASLGIQTVEPGEASIDYGPSLEADNDLYYGQIAWMPEWFDIKLLGSYQSVHTDLLYDFDSSPQPLVYFHASNQYSRVTSAELQFLSKPGGIFPDWMQLTAGLYYFKSDAGYDPVIFGIGSGSNPLFTPPAITDILENVTALLPPGVPLPTSGVQLTLFSTLETEAAAAYLQTTFYPTEWFDITLGARVQHEKRGTTQADTNVSTSGDPLQAMQWPLDSTTRTDFSPKLTLDFKPADDQLFYITGSRASKSGTFNLPAIYTAPRYVKPETVTAYEVGNKGTLFDHALRYSLAGFLSYTEDLQTQIVSLQSGGAQNLVNADEAKIKGVDFDATWQMFPDALPGFVLKLAGSYIKGEYTEFTTGSGFDETSGLFFGEGSLTLQPARDFSGNKAVRTPKYSGTIGPNYAATLPGGVLELGLDYSYNSGYYFDTQNTSKQPAYSVLNARASYLYEPMNLRLTVFGKNLTDELYFINRFETDFATNSLYAASRLYGVTLSYGFGS
jgi:iron complex outermembrane receptor protein